MMFVVKAELSNDYYDCGCTNMCNCGYRHKIDNSVKIATFDTEKQAQDYIKRAKLKRPNSLEQVFFKKRSLLVGYRDAWVDHYEVDDLPHNPKI